MVNTCNSKYLLHTAVYFFLLILSNDAVDAENSVLVQTESGKVLGSVQQTLLDKRPFYSFRGIPYAKPPVGALRFKAPQKVDPWEGTRNATEFGEMCAQFSLFTHEYSGVEDCLFLNVFTPNVHPPKNLPVIFYIHGGAWINGGGPWLGPDILLDEDIVLVTIQYRLGPFGFMTLRTPEYSGNMGLKDQQVALEWVHRNIHSFGGDKDSVTIFGHSVGGSSVHLHLISEQSRQFFKRGIATGGSGFNNFAYIAGERNQSSTVKAYLAGQLNKQEVDVTDGDLQAFIADEGNTQSFIMATHSDFYKVGQKSKTLEMIWAPVVESENAVEPFKTDDLATLKTVHVDSLFGYSSGEFIFLLGPEITNPDLLLPFNEHFDLRQFPLPDFSINTEHENYQSYLNEIRQFYFGNKTVGGDTLDEYAQLLSDLFFRYSIDAAVKNQASQSKGNTFYYVFDIYKTKLNFFRQLNNATDAIRGATHVEDLPFLFKTPLVPVSLYDNLEANSKEVAAIKRTRTFFVNFAVYGSPNGNESRPILNDEVNYSIITDDGIVSGTDYRGEVYRFWKELFSKYSDILNFDRRFSFQ